MALNNASGYPQACQALTSMLSRNSLNPADITLLYRIYSSSDPPPIDLIRIPQLLGKHFNPNGATSDYIQKITLSELLVDSLFKSGVKLNPEHKPKYIYLLAYAASVCETQTKKGQKRTSNKDELKATVNAIQTVHNICNVNKSSSELMTELCTLYQCLR